MCKFRLFVLSIQALLRFTGELAFPLVAVPVWGSKLVPDRHLSLLAAVAMATGMSSYCTALCAGMLLPHGEKSCGSPRACRLQGAAPSETNPLPTFSQQTTSYWRDQAGVSYFSYKLGLMGKVAPLCIPELFFYMYKEIKVGQRQYFWIFCMRARKKLNITESYFLYWFVVSKCLIGVNKAKPELQLRQF